MSMNLSLCVSFSLVIHPTDRPSLALAGRTAAVGAATAAGQTPRADR